jgi:hypothetical protein
MDKHTQYAIALGVFRQQSMTWANAARDLAAAAHAVDPNGQAPNDPVVAQVVTDVAAEFRALGNIVPGIRQLFAASLVN